MALAGLVLLLIHNMALRPMLKAGKPARGPSYFWLRWGDLVIFLVILAGLTLMWSQK